MHVRTTDRLTNRRRIMAVSLVTLDVGLNKLWGYQLHLMTQLLQLPRPVMRRATGLQINQAGRQIRH